MALPSLPSKLGKEPLLDVVFEVRFRSTSSPTEILPGLLFADLSREDEVKVTRLPMADLPAPIRHSEPSLRFSPLVQVELSRYLILVGERSLAIACKLPYPGWKEFRAIIIRIVSKLLESNFAESIERYSLKYVDLIATEDRAEQVRSFNCNIRIGDNQLTNQITNVRMETVNDGVVHAITILIGAQATLKSGEIRSGGVIDVDSIVNLTQMSPPEFLKQLSQLIDRLHDDNKAVFFNCLAPEALTALEPIYA